MALEARPGAALSEVARRRKGGREGSTNPNRTARLAALPPIWHNGENHLEQVMRAGDKVRTLVPLPGIPVGSVGSVTEVGRLFVVVTFQDGRLAYYPQQQLAAVDRGDVGISGLGLASLGFTDEAVPAGAHMCLLPASADEAAAVAERFLSAGLEDGESCVCVVGEDAPATLVKAVDSVRKSAASRGRSEDFRVLAPRDLYLAPQEFTAQAQVAAFAEFLASCGTERPLRMRAFGFAGRLLDELRPEEWWEYERRVTPVLKHFGPNVVCTYGIGRVGSDQWQQAASVHPYVVLEGQLRAGGSSE
jgi:hypothetical protein